METFLQQKKLVEIGYGGVSSPGREKVVEDKLLHVLQVCPVTPEVFAESADSLDVPEDKAILKFDHFVIFQTHPNSSMYSPMLLRVTFSFRIST